MILTTTTPAALTISPIRHKASKINVSIVARVSWARFSSALNGALACPCVMRDGGADKATSDGEMLFVPLSEGEVAMPDGSVPPSDCMDDVSA